MHPPLRHSQQTLCHRDSFEHCNNVERMKLEPVSFGHFEKHIVILRWASPAEGLETILQGNLQFCGCPRIFGNDASHSSTESCRITWKSENVTYPECPRPVKRLLRRHTNGLDDVLIAPTYGLGNLLTLKHFNDLETACCISVASGGE